MVMVVLVFVNMTIIILMQNQFVKAKDMTTDLVLWKNLHPISAVEQDAILIVMLYGLTKGAKFDKLYF